MKHLPLQAPREALAAGWGALLTCAVLTLAAFSGLAGAAPQGQERVTYSLDLFDDFLFGKDDQITGGWTLTRHSETMGDWDDFQGLFSTLGRFGGRIPTLSAPGLRYRHTISLGQVIQTPGNLSRSDLIPEDVPYAGLLAIQAAWYGYDDTRLRGFALTAGVVGPAALGKQVQSGVHQLIGNDEPRGWDNQLANEPVLNLAYRRKRKLWAARTGDGWGADLTLDGHGALGNLYTALAGGLELRAGYNLPGGFAPVADPVGFALHHQARLRPARPERASVYLSAVARGHLVARNLLLDGNTFTNSHGVDKTPVVGQFLLGAHLEYRSVALRFQVFLTTDRVDPARFPAAQGRDRYGIATAEWRF